MNFPKVLILLFVFCTIAPVAFAQDDDTLKIDTSIVRLNIGVVDRKGNSITTLNQSNFKVFEDGVPQDISRFQPTIAPFSLVMILDMSGSTLPMRQVMKQSAFRFIDALSPDDRVAVVEFYDKINLRNDFTTDRRSIANSIEVSNGRGKTQFYKAIDFALNKLAGEGNRRKAIIVLSDGVDTSVRDGDRDYLTKLTDDQITGSIRPETNDILNRVLNKADALGVTIYPLALPTGDPAKLADPTPRQVEMYRAARARLQLVADRSGGTLHKINRLEEMGVLYAQVAAELRTLYTIEYQSHNDKRDGKWRAIAIEVDNPEVVARTRQGYFAR